MGDPATVHVTDSGVAAASTMQVMVDEPPTNP